MKNPLRRFGRKPAAGMWRSILRPELEIGLARACLSIILLIGSCVPARAALPSSELAVLEAIYKGTSGSEWKHREGWDHHGAPTTILGDCHRYGITCTTVQGQEHVSGITLSRNGLTGHLPDSLSALPHLRWFIAYGNQLSGAIPALSGLTELQQFYVEGNRLTGPIPSLTGLTNLEYFDVDTNRLTGSLPSLDGLPKLVQFDAEFNRLSGSIPPFNDVPNLQHYAVYSNQLSGNIPPLATLKALIGFSAFSNGLTGELPDLSGLVNLREFFVESNRLTGPLGSLEGSPHLTKLDVSFNQLSGHLPILKNLSQLVLFNVSSNKFSGAVPAASPSLENAGLCPNPLTTANQPGIDEAWSAATGSTPWWATPFASNQCDDLFNDGYE